MATDYLLGKRTGRQKGFSRSTYFWKSIGGDFEASCYRSEEADEKALELIHFAGWLCQALRAGSRENSTLRRTQFKGTADELVFFKEEKRRKLSNFVQKWDKYLFWSSNLRCGGGSDTQRLFKQQSQRQSVGHEDKSGSDGRAFFGFC